MNNRSGSRQDGGSQLPVYILKREDGIFVDMARLPVGAGFSMFVELLFGNGARFVGLDYAMLMALLYAPEPLSGEVRLADDIVRFDPRRKALYKGVSIAAQGEKAEYVFEPTVMEEIYEEPIYGEPGEDGVSPVVKTVRRVREVPARLDFDEFIADMWLKGLRFGVDADKVRDVIARGIFDRMDVAFQREPIAGSDADMQEANEALQRDDSPKVMANGRTDLKRFKNRFPHVAKGERLVTKVHCGQGQPGRKVTGAVIEPAEPKDFDLFGMVGPGTYVESGQDADFIVAAIDGFLTLDMAANQISVTEKLENRGGVSVRTTGDLSLAVDEFIEHGEVQEGRIVEGKHMTFNADVYGAISSTGGNIRIESNLSGGSAKSVGGNVSVRGRASRAVLEAWDGEVTVQYAEGCIIVGKVVSVEHAINCEIVAQELRLGQVEACGIAGRSMRIASTDARKGVETVLTVLVPELQFFDLLMEAARKTLAQVSENMAVKEQAIAALKAEPEFAKYLALAESIRKGAIRLTDAQEENWRRMGNRFASSIKKMQELDVERLMLLKAREEAESEVERIAGERRASSEGVRCEIDEMRGGTIVQAMKTRQGIAAFRELSATDLKARLRALGAQEDRLPAASEGHFVWQFSAPEPALG